MLIITFAVCVFAVGLFCILYFGSPMELGEAVIVSLIGVSFCAVVAFVGIYLMALL